MGEKSAGPLGGGAEDAGPGVMFGPDCTSARDARLPGPTGVEALRPGCALSGELETACSLPDAATDLLLDPSSRAVHSWLREHQNLIIEAETAWGVDRRAIAGAIAWEALKNIRSHGTFSRWSGPAKVHVHVHFYESNVMTAAEEVEWLGYLGRQSGPAARDAIVATPSGAVKYIGAIMRSCADIVTQLGGYPPEKTYWNPPILTTWYQGKHPSDLARDYRRNKWNSTNHPLLPPGGDEEKEMGTWVLFHLAFLEDAVGRLPAGCRPATAPLKDTYIPAENPVASPIRVGSKGP